MKQGCLVSCYLTKLLMKNRDADEKLVKAGHYKRKAETAKDLRLKMTKKAEKATINLRLKLR